jgi:hypothetical protein
MSHLQSRSFFFYILFSNSNFYVNMFYVSDFLTERKSTDERAMFGLKNASTVDNV